MTRLAVVLLLAVMGLHYGLEHLSHFWPNERQAYKALFYVGQGLKGCLLWVVVAVLSTRIRFSLPLLAVCAYGFIHDSLVAGCRLAQGIGNKASSGSFVGICDSATGFPVSLIVIGLGLLVACIVEQGIRK